MKFSANLGFLWPELSLSAGIHAAATAGFDAVECHFPYDENPAEVRRALQQTGMRMISLNTWPGDRDNGEFGLSAVPGAETRARSAIKQAIDYGAEIGAQNVHVMAGKNGNLEVFLANLNYAADLARRAGMGVLIEPINQTDAAGYFLENLPMAQDIVDRVGAPVKIMFDCYHIQIISGDLLRSFEAHQSSIGHVQFASVPDRTEPGTGEIDLIWLMQRLCAAGYGGYLGAEYIARGPTDDSLNWIKVFKEQ